MPTAWAPIVGRLRASVAIAIGKPLPSSPMRFSTGTRTFSKASSQGLSPIIVGHWRTSVTPGDFISTISTLMPPRWRFSGSVTQTTWQ